MIKKQTNPRRLWSIPEDGRRITFGHSALDCARRPWWMKSRCHCTERRENWRAFDVFRLSTIEKAFLRSAERQGSLRCTKVPFRSVEQREPMTNDFRGISSRSADSKNHSVGTGADGCDTTDVFDHRDVRSLRIRVEDHPLSLTTVLDHRCHSHCKISGRKLINSRISATVRRVRPSTKSLEQFEVPKHSSCGQKSTIDVRETIYIR